MEENICMEEKIEAGEEEIFVEKYDQILGDQLEAVLEGWCGIKDAKFLYSDILSGMNAGASY